MTENDHQGRRAGVATRMMAAGLDAVVVVLIIGVLYGAAAVFRFLLAPRSFTLPDHVLVFSMASALVVLVLYQAVAWWLTGRTYGARVMGLRVLSRSGGPLSFVGALVRALFTAVFPIGLVWVAVSRENRSVHDLVLRTSVVHDWGPRPGSSR